MTSPSELAYFGRIDNWPAETRETLWEQRRFAVMYDNQGSVDPDVLKRAREAKKQGLPNWPQEAGYSCTTSIHVLERMVRACEAGALIYADFRGREGDTVMIGRAVGPIEILEIQEKGEEQVSRYKTVRLHEPVICKPDPVLVALRPRQATFTSWPSASRRVHAVYRGTLLPLDVRSLTPSQVEVLCYEYLRSRNPQLKLLLPLGRSLPDIDIYGWIQGVGKIAAQVMHATTSAAHLKNKAERLANSSNASVQVLFAGEESIDQAKQDIVTSIPSVNLITIEQVFQSLLATSPDFVQELLKSNSRM
jgi:hypothetical protein